MEVKEKLFYFKDEAMTGKNMDAVFCMFLDCSWGVKLPEHLKEKGIQADEIGAIRDIDNEDSSEYQMIVQELENGMYLKSQVWLEKNGEYTGESIELEKEDIILIEKRKAIVK